ncbi:AAA family ATPase [bacterium]|jgi:replicative DNA helicase|nr:AAA family ATPase [bacterium]|tara:strand:- start:1429 stop:2805 length:1377 start_codon:yes stop_codon:yes gene_type:complete
MSENLNKTILRSLLTNEEYLRKVVPFLKPNYFEGSLKVIFKQVAAFVDKHNTLPTLEAFRIDLEQNEKVSDDMFTEVSALLPEVFSPVDIDQDFLLEKTENWCQDRAVHIAVMEAINILDGKSETMTKNAIPDILSEALGVAFDTNIGHDYIDNAEDRFEFYTRVEDKLPFDIELLNKITKGGLPDKTLNIALAGTGVGKSLFMCHVGANALLQGKNVLYITMEMAEERIAERIDANLLDIPIDQLDKMPKAMFTEKVNNLAKKTVGKLIVKEYPTGSAHVGHFRALLKELKLKRSFIPDIIFIDYLNICSSSRMKSMGGAINSYTYIKAIAEELRGLAVEFGVPVLSATQTTRSGYGNSDPGLEDTSESFGLPATADLMFALVSNEELDQSGQIMVKQLKNRYNDPNKNKRFVVGIDRSKMRLYDVEPSDQTLVDDGIPVFDKTPAGAEDKFKGFKI